VAHLQALHPCIRDAVCPPEYPTVGAFHQWLANARAGSVFAYHFGLLAKDRGPEEARAPEVEGRARAAWEAYERREVELTQARVRDGLTAYLATKTGRGRLLG